MSTLYRCRCPTCDSRHAFVNQSIDVVRSKSCERCGCRLVLYEQEPGPEPAAVTQAPGIERITITARTSEIARELVRSALGE